MKKKLAMLIALAMSMTMLAACGDDSSSSSKAETSAPAVEESSAVEDSSEPEASEPESSEPESSEPESSEPEPVEFDGTLYTDGNYPGDWSTPNFVIDADGTTETMFNMTYLEPYKDTGCTLTFAFELESTIDMQTLETKYYDQNRFSIGNANGWEKLYATGTEEAPFVIVDCEEFPEKQIPDDYEGTYYIKGDGFIELIPNDDGTWPMDPITVTLTSDCINYIFEHCGQNDDGTTWGGLIFQVSGVNIQSVTVGEIAE